MGAPRFVLDRFWPSNLFLGGIPGAWYDPTDLSTMFQDSTGTTPVTAVEQPVGLILDKSQGLANGPELSPNVGPYTNTTDWTGINSAVLSATGGELLITAGNTYSGAYITANVVAGTWLDVTIVARRGTATAAYVSILNQTNAVIVDGFGNPSLAIGATNTTVRTRFLVPAGMTQARLLVIHDNQAVGRTLFCSSASARTLAGNHASQSTAASRPTYRARYNLLTYSEQFDNAAWTKGGLNTTGTPPWVDVTTAPDGTTTADRLIETAATTFRYVLQAATVVAGTYTFSVYAKQTGGAQRWLSMFPQGSTSAYAIFDINAGTVTATGGANYVSSAVSSVGNGWFRCSVTCTSTAGTMNLVAYLSNSSTAQAPSYLGDGASGAFIWGAQLLTAADVTATGNAYQRIAAATVYDTAAVFRPYLAFDGVDDSLSTASIDFTSTSKISAFSGVTKSAESVGMIVELSASASANAGFYMAAFTGSQYGSQTGTAYFTPSPYAAPITNTYTTLFDLTQATQAGQVIPRLNRIVNQSGPGPGVSLTGPYGNFPLYIGRRNNATFPFNGRLYSLIVRGAASSVTEIADTELWVNARTGAY